MYPKGDVWTASITMLVIHSRGISIHKVSDPSLKKPRTESEKKVGKIICRVFSFSDVWRFIVYWLDSMRSGKRVNRLLRFGGEIWEVSVNSKLLSTPRTQVRKRKTKKKKYYTQMGSCFRDVEASACFWRVPRQTSQNSSGEKKTYIM